MGGQHFRAIQVQMSDVIYTEIEIFLMNARRKNPKMAAVVRKKTVAYLEAIRAANLGTMQAMSARTTRTETYCPMSVRLILGLIR